jgi:ribosomal protein S27AE
MADYAERTPLPDHDKCAACGHVRAAHGSNGMVCGACECLQFVEAE